MGHSARKGCNKCYADSESDRLDIGLQRSDFAHRGHVAEVLRASTRQGRDSIESKFGVRYSELLRLPYYRPIQFMAVDPMHNLILGTAKTFLNDIWLNNQKLLLSKSDMVTIQERINSIPVPSSMGVSLEKLQATSQVLLLTSGALVQLSFRLLLCGICCQETIFAAGSNL